MPKVSIIMPTYNRGWIIERAIKSVLAQTFADFELIIIDDASTDNTKDVLSKFDDPRIYTEFLSENKKVSAVRNIGVQKAQGEFIAYLDTDNLWYPQFLEVMLSELTDEYVLAYSGQNLFLVDGNKENPQIISRKIRNDSYNPIWLLKGNYIDINSVMHTKKIVEEIGMFDENLSTCEDWDLFARIAIKYPFKIKHVAQVLGEYYFYLKNVSDTVTNGYANDEDARAWFNARIPSGDDKYIQEKLQKLLSENNF